MVFDEEPAATAEPINELRRSYHDRISEVRRLSLGILGDAVVGVDAVSDSLVLSHSSRPPVVGFSPAEMQARAAVVDSEIVALLALESPVARDLRVILSARDVTQLAMLCIGLCQTLSERVERISMALTEPLRRSVAEVAAGTLELLRAAQGAWTTLDGGLAAAVVPQAAAVQVRQTELMRALIGLEAVPMETAMDLALLARAFERLADHAVEIADRVHFAVQGTRLPT